MSTFGESLKRERELRQISLREIAEATKINLRYLDALETNKFDNLPGGVFNRGFVRAYAQYIGADADSLVNAYLLESQEQFSPTGSQQLLRRLAEAKRREGDRADGPSNGAARRVGIAALAALGVFAAGAALWFGWAQRGDDRASSEGGARVALRDATPEDSAPPPLPEPTPPTDESRSDPGAATSDAVAAEPSVAEPNEERTAPVEPPAAPPVEEPKRDAEPAPTAAEPIPVAARASSEADQADRPATSDNVIRARLVIARETSGRLNCDGRQVEMLDGMPAGTALEMECRSYLVLDAADGGGVRVGLGGATPVALVADGVPLRGYRIEPGSSGPRDGAAS